MTIESQAEPTEQPDDVAQAPRAIAAAGFSRLWRLCQKELREILRDRRTIVTLVLMPLMVYPILFLAFQRFLVSTAANLQGTSGVVFRLGVDDEEQFKLLLPYVLRGHEILFRQALGLDNDESLTPNQSEQLREELRQLTASNENPNGKISWNAPDDLDAALQMSAIDLAVTAVVREPTPEPEMFAKARFHLTYREGSSIGPEALAFIEQRVRAVNDQQVDEQLRAAGIQARRTAQIVEHSIVSGPSFSFGALIPLILILMTITGAVYPAIDLTAGERERGTLEALIAAPVSRVKLLLAKYCAVVTVALLTAAANLFAMTLTLYSSGLAEALFGKASITPQSLLAIFLLLVLFAAFFSAVLLAVTSFAKSFKEAQAYLIPLMLISLAPGMLSLAPDIEFAGILTVTPLVNIVLLARDVFQGTVQTGPATAAVISTILYAASAIAIAARIFGTDAVLYGSESSWADWLQRPEKTRPCASLSGALLFLAVLFPLYIILVGLLGRFTGSSMQVKLSIAGLVTMFLFGVLPVAFSLAARIRIPDAFRLRGANALSFLAAGLLGFSLWPLAHELFLLHKALGLTSLGAEQIEAVRSVVESWQDLPLIFVLFSLAIVPAVFEELFFRGFLFTALLRKLSPTRAIVISAVLFGAFHVVSTALTPERFLPSTCMGLVLGWVCWRTKSIFPGIVLHACHNGLLVTVGYYMHWLAAHQFGQQDQAHLPGYWIGLALLGTIAGLIVLRYVAVTDQPNLESGVA